MSNNTPQQIRASFHCVKSPIQHEIEPIKGSRFIAHIAPVISDDDAQLFLEKIRQNYPDARHHCWAYRLDNIQKRVRFNDDGEPSGSAGKPILAPIEGNQLFNTMIIIVRYFGGVKLGVGGLVRAYSQAANEAINHAEIITVTPKTPLTFRFDYSLTSQVNTALNHLNLLPSATEYNEQTIMTINVIDSDVENVRNQLIDYTNDQIDFISLD